jgi:hypothetical protein
MQSPLQNWIARRTLIKQHLACLDTVGEGLYFDKSVVIASFFLRSLYNFLALPPRTSDDMQKFMGECRLGLVPDPVVRGLEGLVFRVRGYAATIGSRSAWKNSE